MVKNLPAVQETWVRSLGWEAPLEKEMDNPLQYPLPGKSHGQRSLVGCSPWGRKESSTTERLISLYQKGVSTCLINLRKIVPLILSSGQFKLKPQWGLPWCLNSQESASACQCRRQRLLPDPGRFHMPRSNLALLPQLLSPHARAHELQLLKPTCPPDHTPQQENP